MTDGQDRPPRAPASAPGARVRRGLQGLVQDADLRLLRVFRTVVEQGGFGPAEVALDKSKSAISLDIAQLEGRLGMRLCTRGRAGFALTDAGQLTYLAALQLFADLDRFRDRVAAAAEDLSGQVRLRVVDNIVSIASAPLVAALGRFTRAHPRVRVQLDSGSPALVEAAILDNDADLGISVVPRPVAALELIPLFREELLLYCGRGHALFDRADRDLVPDHVRVHPLVRPAALDDPAFARLIAGFPAGGAVSDTLDTRVMFVLAGTFLAFLPPHYARAWAARGEIRPVLPGTFRTENTFYALFKKSAHQSHAVAELRRTILQAFSDGWNPETLPPAP
ncbi:LysR family transcriptional regulator [Zavarzinia sp. CC-PAN008]|uniref:LysR family transcriptional regulator n=1 Tax=Zavarzinia sp. CC-PAN008 TaxID=3243332 RepID=UPI003F7423E5